MKNLKIRTANFYFMENSNWYKNLHLRKLPAIQYTLLSYDTVGRYARHQISGHLQLFYVPITALLPRMHSSRISICILWCWPQYTHRLISFWTWNGEFFKLAINIHADHKKIRHQSQKINTPNCFGYLDGKCQSKMLEWTNTLKTTFSSISPLQTMVF